MEAADSGSPAGGGNTNVSLPQMLRELLADVKGQVSDRVHLLALELKRAGLALAQMVGLVIAAALLGLTAWMALWIGLAAALIGWGLAWGWVLLIVLALNAAGIAFALLRVKRLVHLLTLPASKRHLTVAKTSTDTSAPHEPLAQPVAF